MPISDPLQILLAHDRWADRELVDACAGLSDDQLHRRFEMGMGSLHDNLVHMATAMRVWGDVLRRGEVRPRLEGQRKTVAEIRELFDGACADLAILATGEPLDAMVSRTRDGVTIELTRGGVLMQVLTHGMHHRAQCLNMLRQIGAKQPPSAVIEWIRAGEPA